METCATCKWWKESPDPDLPVGFQSDYRICGKIERDDKLANELELDSPVAFIAYEAEKDTFPSPPSQQLFTLGEFGCNQHEPREDAD